MKVLDYVGRDAVGREVVLLDEQLTHLVAPPCTYDKRTRQITSGGPMQLQEGERWWAVGYEGNTTAFLARAKTAHSAWLALGSPHHFSSLVVREVDSYLPEEFVKQAAQAFDEPTDDLTPEDLEHVERAHERVMKNVGLNDEDFFAELKKQNGKSRLGTALDQLRKFFKR